ncbi:MAG: tRNA 2-selenouridine(34) synthase MnmH [Candidatus Babeliaceae bacterium]|nr:tRNA 2-selenouridine(34) synthase MnmH [Candidatus Babeliaceae bacterium]
MITSLQPRDYRARHTSTLTIDVRSPGEFAHGHIPGAVNLPLFSDDERAVVGTLYKKEGRDSAVKRGLNFVSPRLNEIIERATQLLATSHDPSSREIVIYCARGGMRSKSIAMLVACAGYKTYQLSGGFKAYKHFLRQEISAYRFILLGGKTGSGKTALLPKLSACGEQVVDLEKIACHRGSTFGALGYYSQPTQEQFIVSVLHEIAGHEKHRPIWLEHEGSRLGAVAIPAELWKSMYHSPVAYIEVPLAYRKEILQQEYGKFANNELIECTKKLEKRLGGLATAAIITALENNDREKAVNLLLEHYDRAYDYATKRNTHNTFFKVDLTTKAYTQWATHLSSFGHQISDEIRRSHPTQGT